MSVGDRRRGRPAHRMALAGSNGDGGAGEGRERALTGTRVECAASSNVSCSGTTWRGIGVTAQIMDARDAEPTADRAQAAGVAYVY